jgi:transcription elongation factor/antiterminator RfaH
MATRVPEVAGSSPLTQSTTEQHSATRWYVVQTKPHQEERVIAHLSRRSQTIESFLPKIEIVRRHKGRRVKHPEPLFPNYLFVWMPLTAVTWNAVRWTPGARGMLGDGAQPIAVPDSLVDAIRERVEPLGFVRVGLNLAVGVRIRVKSGPFAGLEGIFERPTSRHDRVRVLLEMLGTVTPLEIEVFDLEKV